MNKTLALAFALAGFAALASAADLGIDGGIASGYLANDDASVVTGVPPKF